MIDRDRDIRCQAMLKSIWEGFNHSLADEPLAIMERVETYAKFSLKIIEAYSKIADLPSKPQPMAPEAHLSDEQVASQIKPSPPRNNWPTSDASEYISIKQRNRLYAIWKHANWSDKEVATYLFDKYGLMNTKEIPWKLYNEICKTIESNPK